MRLDPSVYQDLLLSLLPELVLTGWALVLLLFVAWRHKTVSDLRVAGWLTLLALVSTAIATWLASRVRNSRSRGEKGMGANRARLSNPSLRFRLISGM